MHEMNIAGQSVTYRDWSDLSVKLTERYESLRQAEMKHRKDVLRIRKERKSIVKFLGAKSLLANGLPDILSTEEADGSKQAAVEVPAISTRR